MTTYVVIGYDFEYVTLSFLNLNLCLFNMFFSGDSLIQLKKKIGYYVKECQLFT